MIKFSLIEWLAAWRRNAKRKNGTHSLMLKVYDDGRVVFEKEIESYDPQEVRVDEFHIVGRINAIVSNLYGNMCKQRKELIRRMKKCGVK